MPGAVVSCWNHKIQDDARPLAYGDRKVAAVVGWGGVLIFDPNIDIIHLCYEYSLALKNNSCGQCVPCRIGTDVLYSIFERFDKGLGRLADFQTVRDLSNTIARTSRCEVGRSSPEVFLYLIEHHRDAFMEGLSSGSGRKYDKRFSYRTIRTAPCMQACPMHIDIPGYIESIRLGRFREAFDIIRQRLPLPGVLGRVCVRPCESHCRRGLLDEPVQIRHLKRFAADCAEENAGVPEIRNHREKVIYEESITRGPRLERKEPKGVSVAIIGAGPSGLTCAYFLAYEGYDVAIYEKLPEAGGMAAVGIPDYRLPRNIVRDEIEAIERLGVRIFYGKALGTDFTLDDLAKEGFKAVFIGMGCHGHKKMGIAGEDEGYYGYLSGVQFLRNINLGLFDKLPKGNRVAVVGGGNVAIDCVRSAFRVGFEEASIVYRRSKNEMPADPVEIHDAEGEGVRFHFLTAPKRIIAEDGKVAGLGCVRMELGVPDASGRRRPVEIPGSEFVIPCEVVIAAIGQEGDAACIHNLPGVTVSRTGAIVVDENLMTTRKGVFAGGDCISGPDVLIRACNHGRRVAGKIDAFLHYSVDDTHAEENDETFLNALNVFDAGEHVNMPGGLKRVPVRHEPSKERKKDFREVDKGFTPEEAVAEASRCLRCYRLVTYAYISGPW